MTFPLPGANWSYLHGFTLKATTGVSGYVLQNATPVVLSWTAPNDGQLHRAMVITSMDVTSAQTGGAIGAEVTLPDGTSGFPGLVQGGQGVGFNYTAFPIIYHVGPGTTVTVSQTTAMTAGAAKLWAEIWGL